MKVKDVMTKNVMTVRPETTLKEAATMMTEHGISGLPVVDLGGQVETKAEAELVPEFVQRVPGVVSVLSKLNWTSENGHGPRR